MPSRAHMDPDRTAAPQPLCSRRYGVPYDRVWRALLDLLRCWPRLVVTGADPQRGTVSAEARSRLWKFVDDVEIAVSLDEVGRTRVEVRSAARTGRYDFGVNERRARRIVTRLERRLQEGTRRG